MKVIWREKFRKGDVLKVVKEERTIQKNAIKRRKKRIGNKK